MSRSASPRSSSRRPAKSSSSSSTKNPFKAAHSVPDFYATATWVARDRCRLLLIREGHFCDDYFLVEPQLSIHSVVRALQHLRTAFGFEWGSGKTQPAGPVHLSPLQAAHLFNKNDFLNSTLFGKIGPVGKAALKRHQCSRVRPASCASSPPAKGPLPSIQTARAMPTRSAGGSGPSSARHHLRVALRRACRL